MSCDGIQLYPACVLTATVGTCGGIGTHVVCAGASTTSGIPATADPDDTGAVQEAPGAAICCHTGKLIVHNWLNCIGVYFAFQKLQPPYIFHLLIPLLFTAFSEFSGHLPLLTSYRFFTLILFLVFTVSV